MLTNIGSFSIEFTFEKAKFPKPVVDRTGPDNQKIGILGSMLFLELHKYFHSEKALVTQVDLPVPGDWGHRIKLSDCGKFSFWVIWCGRNTTSTEQIDTVIETISNIARTVEQKFLTLFPEFSGE